MSDRLVKADELVNYIRGIIEQRQNQIPALASSSRHSETTVIEVIGNSPQIAYDALHVLITNKFSTESQEPSPGFTTASVQQTDLRQGEAAYRELQRKYEQLKIEHEQLQRKLESVNQQPQPSWGINFGQEKQRLKEQVFQLEKEKAQLEHKINDLSQLLEKQDGDYAEINERLNSALRELSAYRRDPSTHVRADDLCAKYQSFKQQQFNKTAMSIVQQPSERRSGIDIKEQLLAIKAYLSEATIMAAYELFRQEALLGHLQDLKAKLSKMDLPEDLVSDLVEKINHHLKQQGASLEASPDHRREQKIRASIQSIQKQWELPKSMDNMVREFCEGVFALISEMCPPNVPATLWMPEPQSPFDLEKHKEVTGYLDLGYVLEVIFPGYKIGNRIIDRAEVTTTSSVEE